MGTVIAVNGKGGTGKTTCSALIIEYMARNKLGSILAIDADPNHTLPAALGMRLENTMVGVIDEVSAKKDGLPGGMTKDRFIAMRVQESIIEADEFDLLVMGRPEGPGCYCYVNSVLRDVLASVTKTYDFLVIDNAAGMEHISRRTERMIDRLILVSDYSVIGVRSCKQIYSLAKELGIKVGKAYIIINKVSGELAPLKKEIEDTGIRLAGTVEYDDELLKLSVEGRPVSELGCEAVKSSIAGIMKSILEK